MPIYAYKCASCGHGADVMQKLADAPLTVCPACGQPHFAKQITAAGFQLKGSGWYATDFKNGSKGARKETTETGTDKPATSSPASEAAKPASEAAKPASDQAKPATACGSGGCAAC